MVSSFPDIDLELTPQAAFGADLTADPDTWDWTTLTCAHPSIPAQAISRLLPTPIVIKPGVAVCTLNKRTGTATLHLLALLRSSLVKIEADLSSEARQYLSGSC